MLSVKCLYVQVPGQQRNCKTLAFCSGCPDVYYPQQSIRPFPIQHCLVLWQGQKCRNVDPSQVGRERIPSTWRTPALSMSASFVQRVGPFVVHAPPCCPQLLFPLLHLQFPQAAWVATLGLCIVG